MRRRSFLLVSFAARLLADARQQIVELFTQAASALSESNASSFMRSFDRSMPRYEELRENVSALTEQADVLSSIELLQDEGDDEQRRVELDWFLEIRPKQDTGPLVRRRNQVKCRLIRKDKKWKITSFEPLDLLAAPR